MIKYDCPKCRAEMSSPDSMAGQQETCPHCGNVAIAPVVDSGQEPATPPPAQTKINMSANDRRSVNSLGMASLVIGIIASLCCWMPEALEIGRDTPICIQLACFGFLLGIVGLVAAACDRRMNFDMAASGCIVCIGAILLRLFVIFA